MRRFRSLIAAALLAGGCGAAERPPGIACEVGTGRFAFEPVRDGDDVPIIFGPQGGYHVWGSARVRGAGASDAVLRYMLRRPATAAISVVEARMRLSPVGDADGWSEALGATVFVPVPSDIEGQLVSLHVEVVLDDGRRCTSDRTIRPIR